MRRMVKRLLKKYKYLPEEYENTIDTVIRKYKSEVTIGKIVLLNASCADQTVDAVVNAANSGLWAGGGIYGVIFKKAGVTALAAACFRSKTLLTDGATVITPAFQMNKVHYPCGRI